VRDAYGLDWSGFSAVLAASPPGNRGALILPWFVPEITPHVPVAVVRRRHLEPGDVPSNVRAVVEAQMMAMANHSSWMGVAVHTIHATGGASANRDVLQVMADVFGADVFQFTVGNSACLGAALRAWHADARSRAREVPWTTIVRHLAEPVPGSRLKPVPERVTMYADLRSQYAEFERDELALLARAE
jgi:xylulokinase